jgi:hypothetical protein
MSCRISATRAESRTAKPTLRPGLVRGLQSSLEGAAVLHCKSLSPLRLANTLCVSTEASMCEARGAQRPVRRPHFPRPLRTRVENGRQVCHCDRSRIPSLRSAGHCLSSPRTAGGCFFFPNVLGNGKHPASHRCLRRPLNRCVYHPRSSCTLLKCLSKGSQQRLTSRPPRSPLAAASRSAEEASCTSPKQPAQPAGNKRSRP